MSANHFTTGHGVHNGYPQPGHAGPPTEGPPMPTYNHTSPNQGYGGYTNPSYPPPPQGMPSQPQIPMAWMQRPSVPGCPPGLEYLSQVDQLLVHQQVEVLEVLLDVETENKYIVKNSLGQQIYYCKEDSDFCVRNCCGEARPFTIHVTDNNGIEVMTINRPYKCSFLCQCFSCLSCCQDEVEVRASNGQVLGYMKQVLDGCHVKYLITDADRNTVLTIRGPSYFHCKCCGQDVNFKVLTSDGASEVGRITKQWTGFVREAFTDADNFGVQFPLDLDVKIKAVLLGGVFLIDFMFFEDNQNNH